MVMFVFMIMYSNYYAHDNPVVIHYNLASSCKLSIIISYTYVYIYIWYIHIYYVYMYIPIITN